MYHDYCFLFLINFWSFLVTYFGARWCTLMLISEKQLWIWFFLWFLMVYLNICMLVDVDLFLKHGFFSLELGFLSLCFLLEPPLFSYLCAWVGLKFIGSATSCWKLCRPYGIRIIKSCWKFCSASGNMSVTSF